MLAHPHMLLTLIFCLTGLAAAHEHDVHLRGGMVKRRCGSTHENDAVSSRMLNRTSLCGCGSNTPDARFDPTSVITINVKVHNIVKDDGTGALSDKQIRSGIDVLNEDFSATRKTNGAAGVDTKIRFVLVEITRITGNRYFNDEAGYWNEVTKLDTERFMNVYTNDIAALGYAYLPQCSGDFPGTAPDRIMIWHQAYGSSGALPPYDLGRTLTHETGHYLGLEHTFADGCGANTAPGCNKGGDLICDTNDEANPFFGCPASGVVPESCGVPRPYKNYMDYSDDRCMTGFTPEQAGRMRCTIETYRPKLDSGDGPGPVDKLPPPPPSPQGKYYVADKNSECRPKNKRITKRKDCEEAGEELTDWKPSKKGLKVKKSRKRPRCYTVVNKKGKTLLFFNPSAETARKKGAEALCER